MALSDSQFQAVKEQLRKKKANMGDEAYNEFISGVQQRQTKEAEAAIASEAPVLQQIGTGAAKELGQTAIGVGSIGRKIQTAISKAVDSVLGTQGFGLGGESVFDPGEKQAAAQQFLTPETTAEKFGAGATEIATFAIPATKAQTAVKGAGLARRTGMLAGTDALSATAQQGEFDRESIDAAIIAAAFPVAGATAGAVKKVALPKTKEAGGRVINSLIKPLLKDFSYGKNPGQAVADAGITANSLDELAVNIRNVRQQTGQEISNKVVQSTARFDATDALSPLDEALEIANKSPRTNASIINRLQNLKDDLLKVDENGIPTRKLEDVSADDLWQFNKDVGELTRWTGNATDDEIVNKALKNVYSKTRSQLESGVDDIAELSEKYANLKSAEVATEYRDKIAARQGLVSFTGTQAGLGTGLITAAATGGVTTPLLVGATAAAITEASKTPAFKTQLAAWLASTPQAEIQQAFKDAPWLRGAIQSALFDGTVEPDVSNNNSDNN